MRFWFAAALLAMLTACTRAPHDTGADVQALKDNEAQWNKDFAAKDAEKLIAHYADDATLMSPGNPAVVGHDAIHAMLKEMVGDPALSLRFQASRVEVAGTGDFGWTQGSYTMTMTDPATKKPMHDSGSYVTTYRKAADGSWKAVSDIACSGPPPAKP
jgi:uncharacterized protein (TIGR02246 family)